MTSKIVNKRLFFEFTSLYVQQHPKAKTNLDDFQRNFRITDAIMTDFKKYCIDHEIEVNDEDFNKDQNYLSTRLKSEIARHFWGKDGFYYILLHHDNQFKEALNSFGEANRIAMLSGN